MALSPVQVQSADLARRGQLLSEVYGATHGAEFPDRGARSELDERS